jgi:hypothetical protein
MSATSRLIAFLFLLKELFKISDQIMYIYISNCLKSLPGISVSKNFEYYKEKKKAKHTKMMLIITLFDFQ